MAKKTVKKAPKTGKKRKPSAHAIKFGAAAKACHRELKQQGFNGADKFKRVGKCVKEKLADDE